MALDELTIVVDVLDSFSDELDELLVDLSTVKGAAEAVDDIRIDVDVFGEHQLSRLQAQLMALNGQLAQMRMSGIGAGVGGVGRTMSEADKAADTFDITNLRMSDLHNALAKLVPLLLVYIGALPAAIGAILALAGAAIAAAAGLAALTGLGAIGFLTMEDMGLMELLRQIQEDFMDAFEPLARELAPLFEDALAGLSELFQEIASRGDTLLALRDDARGFGRFMLQWIPNVMEAMGKMAEAFGPMFGAIAESLQGMNILRGLTEFMADAAPAFFMFIASLWRLIETLAQMSIGFMEVAAAATYVLDQFINIVTLGGRLEEELGAAIAALMALATAFFVVTGVASVFNGIAMQRAIISLGALVTGLNKASVAAILFGNAIRTALTLSGIGIILVAIGSAVGWLSDKFMGASTSIKDATQALKEFDNVNSSMGDFGAGGGSTFYEFSPDSSRTIINAPDVESGKRDAKYASFVGKQENDSMVGGR